MKLCSILIRVLSGDRNSCYFRLNIVWHFTWICLTLNIFRFYSSDTSSSSQNSEIMLTATVIIGRFELSQLTALHGNSGTLPPLISLTKMLLSTTQSLCLVQSLRRKIKQSVKIVRIRYFCLQNTPK